MNTTLKKLLPPHLNGLQIDAVSDIDQARAILDTVGGQVAAIVFNQTHARTSPGEILSLAERDPAIKKILITGGQDASDDVKSRVDDVISLPSSMQRIAQKILDVLELPEEPSIH